MSDEGYQALLDPENWYEVKQRAYRLLQSYWDKLGRRVSLRSSYWYNQFGGDREGQWGQWGGGGSNGEPPPPREAVHSGMAMQACWNFATDKKFGFVSSYVPWLKQYFRSTNSKTALAALLLMAEGGRLTSGGFNIVFHPALLYAFATTTGPMRAGASGLDAGFSLYSVTDEQAAAHKKDAAPDESSLEDTEYGCITYCVPAGLSRVAFNAVTQSRPDGTSDRGQAQGVAVALSFVLMCAGLMALLEQILGGPSGSWVWYAESYPAMLALYGGALPVVTAQGYSYGRYGSFSFKAGYPVVKVEDAQVRSQIARRRANAIMMLFEQSYRVVQDAAGGDVQYSEVELVREASFRHILHDLDGTPFERYISGEHIFTPDLLYPQVFQQVLRTLPWTLRGTFGNSFQQPVWVGRRRGRESAVYTDALSVTVNLTMMKYVTDLMVVLLSDDSHVAQRMMTQAGQTATDAAGLAGVNPMIGLWNVPQAILTTTTLGPCLYYSMGDMFGVGWQQGYYNYLAGHQKAAPDGRFETYASVPQEGPPDGASGGPIGEHGADVRSNFERNKEMAAAKQNWLQRLWGYDGLDTANPNVTEAMNQTLPPKEAKRNAEQADRVNREYDEADAVENGSGRGAQTAADPASMLDVGSPSDVAWRIGLDCISDWWGDDSDATSAALFDTVPSPYDPAGTAAAVPAEQIVPKLKIIRPFDYVQQAFAANGAHATCDSLGIDFSTKKLSAYCIGDAVFGMVKAYDRELATNYELQQQLKQADAVARAWQVVSNGGDISTAPASVRAIVTAGFDTVSAFLNSARSRLSGLRNAVSLYTSHTHATAASALTSIEAARFRSGNAERVDSVSRALNAHDAGGSGVELYEAAVSRHQQDEADAKKDKVIRIRRREFELFGEYNSLMAQGASRGEKDVKLHAIATALVDYASPNTSQRSEDESLAFGHVHRLLFNVLRHYESSLKDEDRFDPGPFMKMMTDRLDLLQANLARRTAPLADLAEEAGVVEAVLLGSMPSAAAVAQAEYVTAMAEEGREQAAYCYEQTEDESCYNKGKITQREAKKDIFKAILQWTAMQKNGRKSRKVAESQVAQEEEMLATSALKLAGIIHGAAQTTMALSIFKYASGAFYQLRARQMRSSRDVDATLNAMRAAPTCPLLYHALGFLAELFALSQSMSITLGPVTMDQPYPPTPKYQRRQRRRGAANMTFVQSSQRAHAILAPARLCAGIQKEAVTVVEKLRESADVDRDVKTALKSMLSDSSLVVEVHNQLADAIATGKLIVRFRHLTLVQSERALGEIYVDSEYGGLTVAEMETLQEYLEDGITVEYEARHPLAGSSVELATAGPIVNALENLTGSMRQIAEIASEEGDTEEVDNWIEEAERYVYQGRRRLQMIAPLLKKAYDKEDENSAAYRALKAEWETEAGSKSREERHARLAFLDENLISSAQSGFCQVLCVLYGAVSCVNTFQLAHNHLQTAAEPSSLPFVDAGNVAQVVNTAFTAGVSNIDALYNIACAGAQFLNGVGGGNHLTSWWGSKAADMFSQGLFNVESPLEATEMSKELYAAFFATMYLVHKSLFAVSEPTVNFLRHLNGSAGTTSGGAVAADTSNGIVHQANVAADFFETYGQPDDGVEPGVGGQSDAGVGAAAWARRGAPRAHVPHAVDFPGATSADGTYVATHGVMQVHLLMCTHAPGTRTGWCLRTRDAAHERDVRARMTSLAREYRAAMAGVTPEVLARHHEAHAPTDPSARAEYDRHRGVL